jgi:hypothetical protein
MCGAIPSLPQYASMVWSLVKHRDNFTFTGVLFENSWRNTFCGLRNHIQGINIFYVFINAELVLMKSVSVMTNLVPLQMCRNQILWVSWRRLTLMVVIWIHFIAFYTNKIYVHKWWRKTLWKMYRKVLQNVLYLNQCSEPLTKCTVIELNEELWF